MRRSMRLAGVTFAALLSSTITCLADGPAHAKKYAPAPAAAPACDGQKFAGLYAGVHVGTGTITNTLTDRDNFIDRASIQRAEDGYVAGGQFGYNWTKCNVVYGFEADFALADFDSTRHYNGFTETVTRSVDWIATLRSKTGVAVGDLFIYATGGLAFANMETSYLAGANTFRIDSTRVGWVAGLGTEYAINDRMRITGDVLYYDFGTENASTGGFQFEEHNTLWISRIGVNFKLGHREAVYEPLK